MKLIHSSKCPGFFTFLTIRAGWAGVDPKVRLQLKKIRPAPDPQHYLIQDNSPEQRNFEPRTSPFAVTQKILLWQAKYSVKLVF